MSENETLVICPSCGTKNRVDLSKAEKHPACGKCHVALPLGSPVNISDADFESTVLRSNIPVLVDFWAPWCGPCKMVAPVLAEIASEYFGRITVAKINTDEQQATAASLKVQGIPTLILYKGGQPVERITGAVPKSHIEELIRKHLKDS